MKTVNLIQNSKEWLQFRLSRIGASEANIILGVSKFQTPKELFDAKIKALSDPNWEPAEESEPNFIQAKGHRMEPRLRSILELQLEADFPDMVVINDDFPSFMASLDGYSEELNATAEFKYVGQDNFEFVRKKKQCLPQYYPQVQQQLMLTNAEKCYFMVGTDDKVNGDFKYTFCEVPRNQEYIEKTLIPAIHEFIDCLNEGTAPKLLKDDTFDQSLDSTLDEYLCRYKLMTEEQKELESRIEALKKDIFKVVKHNKVNCNGVMIYDIQAKDSISVDYKKFIEDENLEVPASYTKIKKGAKTKKIVFPKNEV
jgi:putative phage-type endonuclease